MFCDCRPKYIWKNKEEYEIHLKMKYTCECTKQTWHSIKDFQQHLTSEFHLLFLKKKREHELFQIKTDIEYASYKNNLAKGIYELSDNLHEDNDFDFYYY